VREKRREEREKREKRDRDKDGDRLIKIFYKGASRGPLYTQMDYLKWIN
jgi:hypothetical protein